LYDDGAIAARYEIEPRSAFQIFQHVGDASPCFGSNASHNGNGEKDLHPVDRLPDGDRSVQHTALDGRLTHREYYLQCDLPGYVWTALVETQIKGHVKSHGILRERVIRDVLLAKATERALCRRRGEASFCTVPGE
jgi:hypothetical protein